MGNYITKAGSENNRKRLTATTGKKRLLACSKCEEAQKHLDGQMSLNQELVNSITDLKNKIDDLENKIDDLENKLKEQGELTQQNEKANVELIQELLNKVEEQKDLIKQKEEVIVELETQQNLNSTNSSLPPSRDPLNLKKISTREKSDKPMGGQIGHPGITKGLSSEVDEIINYDVEACSNCQSDLRNVEGRAITRQVIDIPQVRPYITNHVAYIKCCPNCRKNTESKFPATIKSRVQFGNNIKTQVLILNDKCLVTQKKVQEYFEHTYNLKMSTATINNIRKKTGQQLKQLVAEIKKNVDEAEVKCVDETSVRINGKKYWVHVMKALSDVFYRVSKSRAAELKGCKGSLVHDHFSSYNKYTDNTHAYCNAHHLRELQAAYESDPEVDWAINAKEALQYLCHLKNTVSPEGLLAAAEETKQKYLKALCDGLGYYNSLPPLTQKNSKKLKKRKGHNLVIRLLDKQEGTLLFLKREEVPFTNNDAERALRMLKLKDKISGGFRDLEYAEYFAAFRSYIASAQLKGIGILDALNMVHDLPIPPPLE